MEDKITQCSSDNARLAKAAAAPGVTDQGMLWKIRRQATEFQNLVSLLQAAAHNLSHLEGD
jgi:hypothetical protein